MKIDESKPMCPDCGAVMVLRTARVLRDSKGRPKRFFGCIRYPECRSVHSATHDGKPIGIPVDRETKDLRIVAWRASERVWGPMNSPACRKTQMKEWFQKNTVSRDISVMLKDELRELIPRLAKKDPVTEDEIDVS